MTKAVRHVPQTLILTAAQSLFWIACVATVRPHELIVGIGAVVLGVVSYLYVVRTLPLEFRPSIADLLQLWRLPWYIVSGLAEITVVLARDLTGRSAPSFFRAVWWCPVANNGPETAKRTLAIGYTTIAPNFIVVGIDCGRHQMLFHQVQKSSVPIMTQRLGAGAGQ